MLRSKRSDRIKLKQLNKCRRNDTLRPLKKNVAKSIAC
jgi:hypothetical protein